MIISYKLSTEVERHPKILRIKIQILFSNLQMHKFGKLAKDETNLMVSGLNKVVTE
jgi:hypothetical protein